MSVTCSMCRRELPEEPGTNLTSAGDRRFTVAHVNERGKVCPMGGSDLSMHVAEGVRARKADGSWILELALGPMKVTRTLGSR